MCAFGHLRVCVLDCVYSHICISMDDAAVSFFGLTENDLELLLPVNVSDSGNGSRCVCVCVRTMYKNASGCSRLNLKFDKDCISFLIILNEVVFFLADEIVERSQQGEYVHNHC